MTGYILKLIAIFSMLVDHTGYMFVDPNDNLVKYIIVRAIGRLAFPIFCFMITEGYIHTRNVYKYFFRLVLFAAVSEIPFDLAFSKVLIDTDSQNVFFTLALGMLAIHIINWSYEERFRAKCKENKASIIDAAAYMLIVVTVTFMIGCLAEKIHCDYGYKGIWLISMLYVFRKNKLTQAIAGSTVIAVTTFISVYQRYIVEVCGLKTDSIHSLIMNINNTFAKAGGIYYYGRKDWNCTYSQSSNFVWLQMYAILGLVITIFYNGKRGPEMKYAFYLFYPAHLLLLLFINAIIT